MDTLTALIGNERLPLSWSPTCATDCWVPTLLNRMALHYGEHKGHDVGYNDKDNNKHEPTSPTVVDSKDPDQEGRDRKSNEQGRDSNEILSDKTPQGDCDKLLRTQIVDVSSQTSLQ